MTLAFVAMAINGVMHNSSAAESKDNKELDDFNNFRVFTACLLFSFYSYSHLIISARFLRCETQEDESRILHSYRSASIGFMLAAL